MECLNTNFEDLVRKLDDFNKQTENLNKIEGV